MPTSSPVEHSCSINYPLPHIMAVGTATSATKYTQQELLEIFNIQDPRIQAIFLNSWIQQRALTLPLTDKKILRTETQGELIRKHTEVGIAMAKEAILTCLKESQTSLLDVGYLCCVSSTGFITPGFSALLIKELGLSHYCARLDVVGMGCNAGLNGLAAVTGWAKANPGSIALLVCIEVCSAAYISDNTIRTAVVNSLFADGAAAISITTTKNKQPFKMPKPAILHFASYLITDAIDAMRYEWDDEQGKFSFFLDQETPYIIGSHVESAFQHLLEKTPIHFSDVKHWLIHSGGKKVIDAIRLNLGLTRYDLRHTINVLRDYGNVSSGSFLFSYERLLQETVAAPGDYGIMMTMGPGSTIEMALLQWQI